MNLTLLVALLLTVVPIDPTICQKVTNLPSAVPNNQKIRAVEDWDPLCQAVLEMQTVLTLPAPAVSPGTGSYAAGTSITITGSVNPSTIYYTTNGDAPTTASASCISPCQITLSSGMTLKAMAGAPARVPSLPAANTYTVNSQFATTTSLLSLTNPSTSGQSVTFRATVFGVGTSNPTSGDVSFYDGTSLMGTVSLNGSTNIAAYTTTALATGGHAITATYNGTSTYTTSTSSPLTQNVNVVKTTPSIGLFSSSNPALYANLVTITATVSCTVPGCTTPSGTVTFYDNGVSQATPQLSSGSATWSTSSLSATTHPITATYNGDALYNTITSGTLNQVVQPGAITSVAIHLPPSTIAGGAAYTFSADVVGGAGYSPAVTWTAKIGGTSVGSWAGAVWSAPSATSSDQVVTVTATSVQDNTKSGTASVTVPSNADVTAPAVTGFTVGSVTDLSVPVTITATDNVSVTGYGVTVDGVTGTTPPAASALTNTSTFTYTGTAGTKTLRAWARDAAGNVSALYGTARSVTLTDPVYVVPVTYPTNMDIANYTAQGWGWPLANNERIVLVSAVAAGSATKLSYYTNTVATGLTVRGVIYADNSGTPGSLAGVTPEVTVAAGAARWVDLTFSSPVTLGAGSYWVGLWSGTTLGNGFVSTIAWSGHTLSSTYSSTGSPLASMAGSTSNDAEWPITITVNTNSVTPTAATPTITPADGSYSTAQTVAIADTTSGAVIHYTTNGNDPTATSPTYTGSFVLNVPATGSTTTVIKAMAVAANYNNSAIVTRTLTLAPSSVNLAGVGWTGSQSLALYPKTTDTITCGTNCTIVNLDVSDSTNGNANTPLAALTYALTQLSSNHTVLLRSVNGGTNAVTTIPLTSPITRSTAWSTTLFSEGNGVSYKRVMAYGTQRIKFDVSNWSTYGQSDGILRLSGSHEHWKGFEIAYTPAAVWDSSLNANDGAYSAGATGNVNLSGSYNKIEDFLVHDNGGGPAVATDGNSSAYNVVQDVVAWNNGGIWPAGTAHQPNGFESSGSHNAFIRNIVFNARDDGFDMWCVSQPTLLDNVSYGARYQPDYVTLTTSAGTGIKMGLTGCGNGNSGGGTVRGNLVVKSGGVGIGNGDTYTAGDTVAPSTYDHNTSITGASASFIVYGSGHTLGYDTVTNNVYDNGLSVVPSGTYTANNNSYPTSSPYNTWADQTNGDFSLATGSPAITAGAGNVPAGASDIAMKLLKDNWSKRLVGVAYSSFVLANLTVAANASAQVTFDSLNPTNASANLVWKTCTSVSGPYGGAMTCAGPAIGTVSSTGFYTAPSTSGTAYVLACQGTTLCDASTVTITAPTTAYSTFNLVDVTNITPSTTQQVALTNVTPVGANATLSWCTGTTYSGTPPNAMTCTGSAFGTVSSTGSYTAPSSSSATGYVVACQASPVLCDYATVTTSGSSTVCTSYTYSAWGTCTSNSQSRTVATQLPSGCTDTTTNPPVLTQSCGGALNISPSSFSVAMNGTTSLAVTGGTAPYRWKTNRCGGAEYVGNGSGSGVHTVNFQAPSLPVTCTITVTDSASTPNTATATATVTGTAPTTNIFYVSHASGASDSNAGTIGSPWLTLHHARVSVPVGSTVYIRGVANGDITTNCDGVNTGMCWGEYEDTGWGQGSPLHWTTGQGHAGSSGNPISYRGYPGETVILQPPAGSAYVIPMEPLSSSGVSSTANCSYLTFENLIMDGRGASHSIFRVDPFAGDSDATNLLCHDINLTNNIIRHGRYVAGFSAYSTNTVLRNNEFYENGNTSSDYSQCPGGGDHEHAIYIQGITNTVSYGRIHHNNQAIQVWNSVGPSNGNSVFQYIEIDHNGVNPFAPSPYGNRCADYGGGEIEVFSLVGNNATMTRNNIHHNLYSGIAAGGTFGYPSTGVSINNNWIWSNNTAATANAVPVYVSSGSSVTQTPNPNLTTAP